MEEHDLLCILETAFIYLKRDVNYKETENKYQRALREIVALVKKPRLDVEEKARELFSWSAEPRTIRECEGFIRSLVEENRGKDE